MDGKKPKRELDDGPPVGEPTRKRGRWGAKEENPSPAAVTSAKAKDAVTKAQEILAKQKQLQEKLALLKQQQQGGGKFSALLPQLDAFRVLHWIIAPQYLVPWEQIQLID